MKTENFAAFVRRLVLWVLVLACGMEARAQVGAVRYDTTTNRLLQTTLKLPNGATLTVESGGTLAVPGTFTLGGNTLTAEASGIVTLEAVKTGSNFVFEGDSITTDTAASNNGWPVHLMNLPLFSGRGTKTNVAASSETLANITSEYSTQVHPLRPSANSGAPAYLFVLIGANDVGSVTTATYLSDLESYWQGAKDDGFTVIAYTITPGNFTQAQEDQRQEINAGIRRSTVPDYIVDTAALLPDHLDTNLFGDGLHPTAVGNKKIARETQSSLIERRGSQKPDLTAAQHIAGPLVIGNASAITSGYRAQAWSESTSTATNGALSAYTRWSPSASSSGTGIALSAQIEKRGANYGQDGVAVGGNGFLQAPTNMNSMILFKGFGGNQTSAFGTGGTLFGLEFFTAASPITDASNPIDTAVGLRVNPQKITGVSNGYAIWADGTSDLNILAGKLRVGANTNPSATLDVTGDASVTSGNLVMATAGKGLQVKEGSNARMGTATLSSGTVTVSNTSVTASTRIFVSRASANSSTGIGALAVGTVTASTSFVINALKADASTETNDVSIVNWVLLEPSP